MTVLVYPNNFDRIGDWETDTYFMLLHDRSNFTTITADPNLITVDDAIAAYGETTSVGYSRAPLVAPTRTPDAGATPGGLYLGGDPFDFGIPLTGQWDAATLYREVTNDADSLVLATYSFGFLSADGTNVTVASGSFGYLLLTAQTI